MTNTELKDRADAFRQDLEAHGGAAEKIQEACLDMSPAYIKGLGDNFPDTPLTFDCFHLTQLVTKAVDDVRRQERALRETLQRGTPTQDPRARSIVGW